ncbi:MAG: hypothetical protein AAFO04_20140 [Cyanobacteria bacterium J06592_8]
MNFEIFDEEYYLKRHPFLIPAIEQGVIESGLDHFQRFGLQAGLTGISRYFDEIFYLANNPGIQAAVNAGQFASGLEHFIRFGADEGRTLVTSDYNESFYLASNPDIVPFVENGTFRNGLQHFIQFGTSEERLANSFLEREYLSKYPDVAASVEAGDFRTGRHHYEQIGQFDPSRSVTFVGTREDDVVEAFGLGEIEIIGVEVGFDEDGNRIYESNGLNFDETGTSFRDENDILIGTPGSDTFVIGIGRALTDSPTGDFYQGFGTARVLNFDPEKDSIQLAGTRGSGYTLLGTTVLNASRYGLVSVEGFSSPGEINFIFSGELPIIENFLEDRYLLDNPDVRDLVQAGTYESGLDHYKQVGQFESDRSATFVGTSGNDVVTAFGAGPHDITGVERIGTGTYTSNGSDEFDVLIGSSGAEDTFILGRVEQTRFLAFPRTFYLGEGEARIQNFSQADGDNIRLVLSSQETYDLSPSGADLVLSVGGDTVAILEGGAGLSLTPTDIVNVAPFYQELTFI